MIKILMFSGRMMLKILKKRKDGLYVFIFLLILLLFHGLSNYFILSKSRYCLGPDNTTYFRVTKDIFHTIANMKLNLKWFHEFYVHIFTLWKPPLFFLTASPFLLFGIDKNIVIMSNLIYFAILLFSTYGIGKRLFNSEVGILSAFLVSMFPAIFAFSRVLMIDFALTAMVALTFYLFIVNKFGSVKYALLLGGVIGLGTLTKHGYFVFLLPPLLSFLITGDNLKNKKILRNFLFSIILGLLIASNFYLLQFNQTKEYCLYSIFQWKGDTNPFYYLYVLLRLHLLPIYFLLFLVSAIFLVKKKRYPLFIMIFIPLVIFSASDSKVERFILPIFPYIAISICGFIWSLKVRKILLIILILFSLLQYFVISYQNILPISQRFSQKLICGLKQGFLEWQGLLSIIDEGDWDGTAEEIIKIIRRDIKKNKIDRRIRLLFIGQTWKIHTTIDYLLIIKGLSELRLCRSEIDPDFIYRPWLIDKDFDNYLMQFDLIIVEEILPENRWIHTNHLFNAFKRNSDKFSFIKTVVFPGNLTCHVYKGKNIRQ